MAQQVSLKQLKEVKKWFNANPHGVVCLKSIWPERKLNQEKWQKWFIDCLNEKINRFEVKKGGKDCFEWFMEMKRSSRQLNTKGLIINWLPSELKSRFSHRLRENIIF